MCGGQSGVSMPVMVVVMMVMRGGGAIAAAYMRMVVRVTVRLYF